MDVGLIIKFSVTFDFAVKSLETLSHDIFPKTLCRERPHVRSSDNAALFSSEVVGVDLGRVTGKAKVLWVLVLLRVSLILLTGLRVYSNG